MNSPDSEINMSDENDVQREGMMRYGLTREQVASANFGQDTLTGMHILQSQDRRLTNQAAFAILEGLNRVQINGITQYNLNRDEVQTPNFGNHTLNGILNLRIQNIPIDQAFERVRELETDAQVSGVTEYDLDREEVQTANFGQHTLTGIDAIRAQNAGLDNHQAFNLISGLNEPQVLGRTNYQLTTAQINTVNFGMHTLMAMDNLMEQNQLLTHAAAFERVRGLNSAQAMGVGNFSLSREDVNTPNFGNHTLDTMNGLMAHQRAETMQEAFQVVSGLNNRQTTGIRRGLERADVTSRNFDIHTLFGIEYLQTNAAQNGNENLSYQEAFQTVRELDAVQVRGITEFDLRRDQVLNSRFGSNTLLTITSLQTINPEATSQYLYDSAMALPEYQIRGLTKLGLSAEQVGLAVVDNQFVQLPEDNQNVASGKTIDAIDHLVSNEAMQVQEAYEISMNLDTTQILAMTEFGLSLAMVQHPGFLDTDNVLNTLAAPIVHRSSELSLPLSQEEKESLKDDISRSGSVQSLSQLYANTSQEDEQEERSLSRTSSTEAVTLPYAAAASLPDRPQASPDADLTALTRAMSLNSISERSVESSESYPSDEERKQKAKKSKVDKKSSRRNRKR
jgi:hypothetical protein